MLACLVLKGCDRGDLGGDATAVLTLSFRIVGVFVSAVVGRGESRSDQAVLTVLTWARGLSLSLFTPSTTTTTALLTTMRAHGHLHSHLHSHLKHTTRHCPSIVARLPHLRPPPALAAEGL